jgi:hypothetical protein
MVLQFDYRVAKRRRDEVAVVRQVGKTNTLSPGRSESGAQGVFLSDVRRHTIAELSADYRIFTSIFRKVDVPQLLRSLHGTAPPTKPAGRLCAAWLWPRGCLGLSLKGRVPRVAILGVERLPRFAFQSQMPQASSTGSAIAERAKRAPTTASPDSSHRNSRATVGLV